MSVFRSKMAAVVALAVSVTLISTVPVAARPADPGPYRPVTDGYPQATCFWFGPMGKMHPRTNLAYPDEGAWYWGARFRLPAGSVLRFRGDYPQARFMSMNAYLDQGATDSREDRDISPDPGSTNPYREGSDRFAKPRAYTLTIAGPGTTLPGSTRNVLKLPGGSLTGASVQELIYRVYLPDRKRDRTPKSLPRPELKLADGQVLRGQNLCRTINDQQRFFTFQVLPVPALRALVNTPGSDPAVNPALDPLRWEKYFNTPLALSIYRYGTPSQDTRLADLALGQVGGYYDNKAVSYTVGPVNRNLGNVIVLDGKLPTTPRTGPGVERMTDGQVRYWSICMNGSPSQTDVIDCADDARVRKALHLHRRFVIVVSTRADRPENARRACGYTWLNYGSRPDPLGLPSGTLIMRNLMARRDFKEALQRVQPDEISVTTWGRKSERDIMGPYSPTGRYTSTAAFERRGCRAEPAG